MSPRHRGRDAANGIFRGAIEKGAAINATVDVRVEQNEQILIEVVRSLAFHVRVLLMVSGQGFQGECVGTRQQARSVSHPRIDGHFADVVRDHVGGD